MLLDLVRIRNFRENHTTLINLMLIILFTRFNHANIFKYSSQDDIFIAQLLALQYSLLMSCFSFLRIQNLII